MKNVFLGFLCFICFVYVSLNITLTQFISPLYFHQISNERESIVEYLKSIRTLPQFNRQLVQYKQVYGNWVEQEVFSDAARRHQQISNIHQILQKNPNNRDQLHNLYLLYTIDGEKTKALEYLRMAQKIDPEIQSQL